MKKSACFAFFALFTGFCFAQVPPPGAPEGAPAGPHQKQADPARFAQVKQEILNRQQERINVLQQGMACISAAQNHEQLRVCREQEHQAMEQMQRHP